MSKVVLTPVGSGYNLQTLNDNFAKIEAALNNSVFYRNNPPGEPNGLSTDMDVNGRRLYNIPRPLTPSEAVPRSYVDELLAGVDGAGSSDPIMIPSFITEGEFIPLNDFLGYQDRTIEEFGAIGDGIADDTVALELASNYKGVVKFGVGIYTTTLGVVSKRGMRWIGQGTWSATASDSFNVGTSIIRYTGAAVANSCVVRIATEAVGVFPATPSTREMMNVTFTGFVVDGGANADFGVYMVRAWSSNVLDYLTVTNTKKHGFYAALCWNGSPTNWLAYKNLGAGITLGANIFGWSNSAVDQSTCTSFFAYFSGHSFTTVAQNQFNEVSAPDKEYGIGVFGSRGLVLVNPQAAQCGGAGFYTNTSFYPVLFQGGYAEGNGVSTGSTRNWDIWVNGVATAASWNITFDNVHLGLATATRLTGTAPSRPEHGVLFKRMATIDKIAADWRNYRLEDCNRNATFLLSKPDGFRGQHNLARNMDAVGLAVFSVGGGTMNILRKEGIVSDVTRLATGIYEVTFDGGYADNIYGVVASGGDKHTVGTELHAAGSVRVYNRNAKTTVLNTDGALDDDNSRITVLIYGNY